MARITQYPEETSPSANDVVLIDGANGSRKVKYDTLKKSLKTSSIKINRSTKYSDVESLISDSIESGNIPHIIIAMVSNPGAAKFYRNVCLTFNADFLGFDNVVNDFVFSVYLEDIDDRFTIKIGTEGTEFLNMTNISMGNVTLYY